MTLISFPEREAFAECSEPGQYSKLEIQAAQDEITRNKMRDFYLLFSVTDQRSRNILERTVLLNENKMARMHELIVRNKTNSLDPRNVPVYKNWESEVRDCRVLLDGGAVVLPDLSVAQLSGREAVFCGADAEIIGARLSSPDGRQWLMLMPFGELSDTENIKKHDTGYYLYEIEGLAPNDHTKAWTKGEYELRALFDDENRILISVDDGVSLFSVFQSENGNNVVSRVELSFLEPTWEEQANRLESIYESKDDISAEAIVA